MWLVRLFYKSMALLLSCIILFCPTLYPCASIKYLDHSILSMVLSTPIISCSVELFPFIFCFVENLDTTPFTTDIMDPVCTISLHPLCTKHLPTISPLTCHQRFRWVSVTSFPLDTSTLAEFPPSIPSLVSSCAHKVIPLLYVCLGVPWHSLIVVFILCRKKSVNAPLSGTMFYPHHVPWRGGELPGWTRSCTNSLETLVSHYLGNLSWITSLLLVTCSRGTYPNSYVPFPSALWILHRF